MSNIGNIGRPGTQPFYSAPAADLRLCFSPPDLPALLAQRVAAIPPGRVATYGQLATALGDVRAAMWVAKVVRSGRLPGGHRVVGAGGVVGSAAMPSAVQVAQLQAEGVPIVDGRVDLPRCQAEIARTEGPGPLESLRALQGELAARVALVSPGQAIKRVAALDVSYAPTADGDEIGVAACVVVDAKTGDVVGQHFARQRVTFPYISTYLTFREMPLLIAALGVADRAGAAADLLIVDGAGILHPWRAGIASMLGVVTDRPAIGVAKSRLCGTVDETVLRYGAPQPVFVGDEFRGLAILTTPTAKQPLYVSPAHRQSMVDALRWVERFLDGKHRLPRPLALADRLSREEANRRPAPVDPH